MWIILYIRLKKVKSDLSAEGGFRGKVTMASQKAIGQVKIRKKEFVAKKGATVSYGD
jgi:hypothetical protein